MHEWRQAAAAVAWTSLLSSTVWTTALSSVAGSRFSFPVTHLWNHVLNRAGTNTIPVFLPMSAPKLPAAIADTGSTPAEARLIQFGGARLKQTFHATHRLSYFHTAGLCAGTGQVAGSHVERSLERLFQARSTRQAQLFQTTFASTIATAQLTAYGMHTPATSGDGTTFTSIREFRQEIHNQLRMLTLHATTVAAAERSGRAQVELHLRTVEEGGRGRPSMKFAEPASTGEQELLAAIRNVEKAIVKVQSVPMPTASQAPDIQRLTAHVYDQLERQLRIERERRGRN
jgi:hypothetical protein